MTTAVLASLVVLGMVGCRRAKPPPDSWKREWQLPKGFSVAIDTEGFSLPTAIAFVPNPGPGPKDPLYFVTELRSKVKVVTRDRSIYTFAESHFKFSPEHEIPSTEAESGMAGIALDPVHGYVFVSLAYHDEYRVMRNNVIRYQSEPGVFSLQPKGPPLEFTDIFDEDIAAITHQAGAMIIDGDRMFVSVGDGGQHFKARQLDSILGKVLRMTLDGKPAPENPFYKNDDVNTPANYVWAYGLRNPFGLSYVNGRLFASENGFDIDRFIEIEKGRNYGWDGTDWSIGMNALNVFGPLTVSPVHLQWMPADNPLFPPEYRSRFFLVLHGGKAYESGLVTLDVDFERSRMAAPPKQFALHTSERQNRVIPTGVALGPDGLYLVNVLPVRSDRDAKGAVIKITYSAQAAAPPADSDDPDEQTEHMMNQKGCFNCHGKQPTDLNVAPPLDRETLVPRIIERLKSNGYKAQVKRVEKLTIEPYKSFAEGRMKVLQATGEEQAKIWIKYHVLEPRFDQTASAMPTLGLSEKEADDISAYLLRRNIGAVGASGFFRRLIRPYVYGPASRQHLPGAFLGGFVTACLMLAGISRGRRVLARRKAKRAQVPAADKAAPPPDTDVPDPSPKPDGGQAESTDG